jgi:PAS domain S-box-containing protein
MKLSSKLSLTFFLVPLILTSSLFPVFYSKSKSSLKDNIWANLTSTAKSRANHIETYLNEDKHRVRIMAESNLIESAIEKINRNTSDSNKFIAEANLILKDFMKADNEANELFILNPDGKIIASTNEKNIGLDKSGDSVLLGGMKNTIIKDAHYHEPSGKPTYSISTPVRDDVTKELLGILVANYYLDGINEITTDRTGLGETGEIYIVNRHDYMITPSRFKEGTFLKQKIDTENARNALFHKDEKDRHDYGIKDTTLAPDYRGIHVLGAHELIEGMQWRLLAEIDAEEALKPLIEIRNMFTVILIVVPIFALLMGIYIARKISGPIEKLSKGAEVIGSGDFNHKVGTDVKDEIGQLSRTFDQMTDNLKVVTASRDELNKEIIERKHAEEQLIVNKERLNYLLTENPAVIYCCQASGDYRATFISRNVVNKMGYKPEDFTENPKFWIDHIHPEDKERVLASLSAWNKKGTYSHEYRFLSNFGSYHWMLDEVRLMLNEEGKPKEMIGSWTDITKRKKAEELLHEREQYLQSIINAEPECVKIISSDGTLMQMNPAGLRMIEADSFEQVKGKSVYPIIAPKYQDAFRELTESVCLGNQGVLEFEITGLKGTRRWFETHAVPFRNAQNDIIGLLGVTRDITEHKKALEEIRQLNKELEGLNLDQRVQTESQMQEVEQQSTPNKQIEPTAKSGG